MNAVPPIHVLYVAAQLPRRSETFVYREVLGLRRRGRVKVSVASVHAPQRDMGEPSVDALAGEAVQVYPPGKWRLLMDAGCALTRATSWRALVRGAMDATWGRGVPLAKRPKVIVQCLAGLALAWRVRGRGIDHLHAHMAHVPTTIAMYAALALGVTFSFTGHAADLFRDRCLLAAKIRRSRRVICISRWHRRFYRGIAAVPVDQLPVVRCGVDVDQWGQNPIRGGRVARIMAVGRLVPKKGIDVLIRALALLRDRGVDAPCTVVGDGPERESLDALVRELRLGGRVKLVGAQSNETVRLLMADHDVLALPCRTSGDGDRDGIPVVLMEAMACGLAVVSGDLPTIRELIDDAANGLLVPPDDVASLAFSLERLLLDESLRARLGAAGRETIEAEYSLELNLGRLEEALDVGLVSSSQVELMGGLGSVRPPRGQALAGE
jgi:glycosyltransferase involved in cell wall biosynthesis